MRFDDDPKECPLLTGPPQAAEAIGPTTGPTSDFGPSIAPPRPATQNTKTPRFAGFYASGRWATKKEPSSTS
jgi:hypothetical protein